MEMAWTHGQTLGIGIAGESILYIYQMRMPWSRHFQALSSEVLELLAMNFCLGTGMGMARILYHFTTLRQESLTLLTAMKTMPKLLAQQKSAYGRQGIILCLGTGMG